MARWVISFPGSESVQIARKLLMHIASIPISFALSFMEAPSESGQWMNPVPSPFSWLMWACESITRTSSSGFPCRTFFTMASPPAADARYGAGSRSSLSSRATLPAAIRCFCSSEIVL